MGLFLLSNFSSPPISSPSLTTFTHYKPPPLPSSAAIATTADNKTLTRAICNGVSILLSFGLFFSSPQPSSSIAHALDSPSAIRSSPSVSMTERNSSCREDEEEEKRANTSQVVTNEGIVEEAWEIVYDSFLDTTNRHRWSPETWLVSSRFHIFLLRFGFVVNMHLMFMDISCNYSRIVFYLCKL